jgi:phosphatidylinositol dimannoside acyltransferase
VTPATRPAAPASEPPDARRAPASGETPRWYSHGWNRSLSWRLIHAIIPRVPRALRPPIHLATTCLCFAAMPRERRAGRRNLERITGRSGLASRLLSFRLFYNFSKFMVGYTDLLPFRPERIEPRVQGREEARRDLEARLAEGKGLIIVTLHLGNWEVGLRLLARLGRPVNVVLRPEERTGPARFSSAARSDQAIRVIEAGGSAWNGLDLLLALRRGEIVTMQGDRAFGPQARRALLFGAPVDLPSGPLALAQASGAPVVLVCCAIRGHDRYRFHIDPPIRVGPGEKALDASMELLAAGIEGIVRLYPTQWFNFYDVWDGGRISREVAAGRGGPARISGGPPRRPDA